MQVEEFQRLLQCGLGRAVIYLQTHDASPYREVLAYACTHNISCHPQTEGTKTTYLFDLIDLTGESEFYRRCILAAATQMNLDTPKRDANHLLDMLMHLVGRDDRKAHRLLYSLFKHDLVPDPFWWAGGLVELDGLGGFLFVVKKFVKRVNNELELDISTLDYLMSTLDEYNGEEKAQELLTKKRRDDAGLDEILTQWDRLKPERKKPYRGTDFSRISYAEIKAFIENNSENKPRMNLRAWGKFTSAENLILAAHDLLKVDNPEYLLQYLKIFTYPVFPFDPQHLIDLTHHSHDRVWRMAFKALENITHPTVRAFALAQIATGEKIGLALSVLAHNFQLEDWILVETLTLPPFPKDEDEQHSLQMGVREVFEHNPSVAGRQAVLNMYEYGICSFCREILVDHYHRIDSFPPHLQAECLWDSNLDIRALAENNFQAPNEDES